MSNTDQVLPAAKRMHAMAIEQDAIRRASNALRGWVDVGSHQVWLDEDKRVWAAFCIIRRAVDDTGAYRDTA